MKKNSAVWLLGILLAFIHFTALAQNAVTSTIEPYRLAITASKTTNLIFPFAVKSIDKGSREVLVQKAIGVENVLQVKAAKQGFAETNLTVVTADGSLYSYVLNYADTPTGINIKVQNAQVTPAPQAVFTADATNDIIQRNAEKLATRRPAIAGPKDRDNGAGISLTGLYVQDEILYFQFRLDNISRLGYDVKLLRFFIRDKKKAKRTATQEIEMAPTFVLGNTQLIRSSSEQTVIIVLPKFTIPDKKVFVVQMQEQNGGRNLQLTISNKDIFKAGRIL